MSSEASLRQWLSSLLTICRIAEVDESGPRYRVEIDGPDGPVISGWLTALVQRAGEDVDTWFYDAGEQVLVAALDPYMQVGVVLGAINQAAHPPASNEAGVYTRRFGDGTEISYDRNASILTLNAAGNVQVVVAGDATVQVDGSAAIEVAGEATMDAEAIRLNGGAGVVTGESRCHFNGQPHVDCSSTVFAGKNPG